MNTSTLSLILKKKHFILLVAALTFTGASGCDSFGDRTEPTMTEQEYTTMWMEVMLLHQNFTTDTDTSELFRARDSLMTVRGYTWQEFLSNHAIFERDLDGQKVRIDSIQTRLREEIRDVGMYIRQMESEGDTTESLENTESLPPG